MRARRCCTICDVTTLSGVIVDFVLLPLFRFFFEAADYVIEEETHSVNSECTCTACMYTLHTRRTRSLAQVRPLQPRYPVRFLASAFGGCCGLSALEAGRQSVRLRRSQRPRRRVHLQVVLLLNLVAQRPDDVSTIIRRCLCCTAASFEARPRTLTHEPVHCIHTATSVVTRVRFAVVHVQLAVLSSEAG